MDRFETPDAYLASLAPERREIDAIDLLVAARLAEIEASS
jgi:hypothetical protein